MKNMRVVFMVLIMTILFSVPVGAAMLIQYTTFTYVESDHPNWFTYYGYVSVRGADWININSKWHFPLYSRITYRVPNKTDQVKRVDSQGKDDKTTRKGSITVKDSLNPVADKTQVFWSIGLGDRNVKPGDPTPYANPIPMK